MRPHVWLGEFFGGVAGRRASLLDFCARQLGVERERLTLTHDDLGAPLLQIDGAQSQWRISSSSRENICLFGLARERIGVDVEILNPIEPAWNVLHEEERRALAALPRENQADEFLRLWTVKEAYVKALGAGLRREPAEIRVESTAQSFRIFDRDEEVVLHDARQWRENIGARTALCACVSFRRAEPEPRDSRRKRLYR